MICSVLFNRRMLNVIGTSFPLVLCVNTVHLKRSEDLEAVDSLSLPIV